MTFKAETKWLKIHETDMVHGRGLNLGDAVRLTEKTRLEIREMRKH